MQKGFGVIYILIGILVLGGVAGGAYLLGQQSYKSQSSPNQQACTKEAKICPDGSGVGRTGPNCEFAACPADQTTNWKIYKNTQLGFEIKYPPEKVIDIEEEIIDYELEPYRSSSISFIFNKEDCSPHFCEGMHLLIPKVPEDINNLRDAIKEGICGQGCINLNGTVDKLVVGSVEALGQGNPFSDNSQTYDAHFMKDKYLYNVTLFSRNTNISKYRPLFDQMLTTFRFQ